MVTCPAAAEQNDGDKRRENGPGKVSTFSVGQGETPRNLLTVIHKVRKAYLRYFCQEITTATQDLPPIASKSTPPLVPLIESRLAPGPEIVTFLVIPSPPLVSVMVPVTAKLILSPLFAFASA